MPIETQWLVTGRIIYVRMENQVAWDDIVISDLMVQALLDTVNGPVHTIVDSRRLNKTLPWNLRTIVDGLRGLQHENQGDFILVSHALRESDLLAYGIRLFTGVFATRMDTPQAALHLLAERDDTLPDLRDVIERFDDS